MAGEGVVESVVHEFEVLYSKRIHQKDKKWCDGVLRYYEFNGKIEIYNEDGNVIATDYAHNKNHSYILETRLRVGNQFKLSTNAVVVEVSDKISRYTREVTFKKKTPVSLDSITYENYPDDSIDKPQDTIVKRESEPDIIRDVRVKIEGEHVSRNLLNPLTPLRSNRSLTSMLSQGGVRPKRPVGLTRKSQIKVQREPVKSKPPLKDSKRPNILSRVHPRTSKHFKYLNYEPTSTNMSSVTVKSEHIQSYPSKQTLDDAPIIYDFSDFEEDQRFSDMLKQIQDSAEDAVEDSIQVEPRPHNTPPKLFEGMVTPQSTNKNQSYDFDLSTQSDFDDVDLPQT